MKPSGSSESTQIWGCYAGGILLDADVRGNFFANTCHAFTVLSFPG